VRRHRRAFLRSLKERGLTGVRLVISDAHAGLVSALGRVFQGVGHQRCRVHYADLLTMPTLMLDPSQGNGLVLARSG
jgi:transposase-like protein